MSADPAFVEWSLAQALRGTFPHAGIPEGYRICVGAGDVAPDDWICLDVSEKYPDLTERERLKMLARGMGKARWDSSGTKLPELFGQGTAAVVYAHHVLEHIPVHQWGYTLKCWASVLRPGGILYLCQPDLEAICARILEGLQPGAAAAWFEADPVHRTWPGDTRAGLTLHDESEGGAWFWLYAGGDHLSVPTQIHVQHALEGTGYRLFVSMEACYVGRREVKDAAHPALGR
jgi:SAM-dependent methyltransferase